MDRRRCTFYLRYIATEKENAIDTAITALRCFPLLIMLEIKRGWFLVFLI